MSGTPRTDDHEGRFKEWLYNSFGNYTPPPQSTYEFARQLEQELNKATKENGVLRVFLDQAIEERDRLRNEKAEEWVNACAIHEGLWSHSSLTNLVRQVQLDAYRAVMGEVVEMVQQEYCDRKKSSPPETTKT